MKNTNIKAPIQANSKLGVRTFFKDKKIKRATQQKLQIGQQFSKEQELMQEMFGGNSTLGQGHNLPVMNGSLMPNTMGDNYGTEDETAEIGGLIKTGRTSSMFGF